MGVVDALISRGLAEKGAPACLGNTQPIKLILEAVGVGRGLPGQSRTEQVQGGLPPRALSLGLGWGEEGGAWGMGPHLWVSTLSLAPAHCMGPLLCE